MNNPEHNVWEALAYFRRIDPDACRVDEATLERAVQQEHYKQPLYVKILSATGGVLTSMAFTGFLFMAGVYKSGAALLFAGGSLLVASVFWSRSAAKVIADTLVVAAFTIGLMMLGLGMGVYELNSSVVSVLFLIIALAAMVWARNQVLSFVAGLVVHGSILNLMFNHKFIGSLHVYAALLTFGYTCWLLQEARIVVRARWLLDVYMPLRTAGIFACVTILWLLAEQVFQGAPGIANWLLSVVLLAHIIYVLLQISPQLGCSRHMHKTALCAVALLALLPLLVAPELIGSLLLLLLCFRVAYRTGCVIALLALLCFVSRYYYYLDLTLLTKSLLLMASGGILLIAYLITSKKRFTDENAEMGHWH